MNSQHMTAEQIRQAGIELLTTHLGITGMIRFFQQSELGQGDYTKARHQWLGQPDSQTVAEELKHWRESRQV